MKKTIILIFILIFCSSQLLAKEIKCDSILSKLKPACNFIGKGAKKLKIISENNKTIDQSYKKIKNKITK